MSKQDPFDTWLDEFENFSTRRMRLYDELPLSTDWGTVLKWMRAAYEVGLNAQSNKAQQNP